MALMTNSGKTPKPKAKGVMSSVNLEKVMLVFMLLLSGILCFSFFRLVRNRDADFTGLMAQLRATEEVNKALKRQVQQSKLELSGLSAQAKNHVETGKELASTRRKLDEATKSYMDAAKELLSAQKRLNDTSTHLEAATSELEVLRAEKGNLQGNKEWCEREINTIRQQQNDLKVYAEGMDTKVAELTAALQECQGAAATATEQKPAETQAAAAA